MKTIKVKITEIVQPPECEINYRCPYCKFRYAEYADESDAGNEEVVFCKKCKKEFKIKLV